MNKRILACGDFSQVPTGYGVYMNGLLTYLHSVGYEVGELACGCEEDDPRITNAPWVVFPNIPKDGTPNREIYNKTFGAEYGAWQFEALCLKFKPTHVIDIRDIWMYEFELRSPLKDYFASVIMPAVDAIPQHRQWLETYSKADKVITYTQWAQDLLANSGHKINLGGIAPPLAQSTYKMIPNRSAYKESCGMKGKRIIGMVGRNQRRKLFPKLFEAFAQYLKETNDNDAYLYIHTAFPDRGWEIDHELLKYGISHRTLLTYICKNCGEIQSSLYKGTVTYCDKCHNTKSCQIASGGAAIPSHTMSQIYNLFDVYVQWHTNEGYAIPVMEALACGVPTVVVGYSAAEEVSNLGGGTSIKPLGLYQEMETGRMMAVPDNDGLVKHLKDYFAKPEAIRARANFMAHLNYRKNWSTNPYDTWVNAIESTNPKLPWNASIKQHNIAPKPTGNMKITDYAKYLIVNVLGEPHLLGTSFEGRLIRDLNNGYSPGGFGGVYYHELNSTQMMKPTAFNADVAYNTLSYMAQVRNEFEKARVNS